MQHDEEAAGGQQSLLLIPDDQSTISKRKTTLSKLFLSYKKSRDIQKSKDSAQKSLDEKSVLNLANNLRTVKCAGPSKGNFRKSELKGKAAKDQNQLENSKDMQSLTNEFSNELGNFRNKKDLVIKSLDNFKLEEFAISLQ